VQQQSPPAFADAHLPELALDRVETDQALAIFYTIAGQSLRSYRTLSSFRRQSRLERLFAATNEVLLAEWNPAMAFETVDHPQELLTQWLGFRLQPGKPIETFLREVCQLPADTTGFLVRGNLLPNPLHYARQADAWGPVRPLDAARGLQHGDLNTNNILAKFGRQGDRLDGYYLIDFALFKPDMPLLYDQRYLEMSYLIHSLSNGSFSGVVDLINGYSEADMLAVEQAPIEMAGVNAVLRAGRQSFASWVEDNHPSLHDDLWGQYWLAGSAAGLGYCHKAGMADEMRLAGLIFAAASLKRFFRLFDLPLPTEGHQLYAEGEAGGSQRSAVRSKPEARVHLPSPPTPLVGRTTEVDELRQRLRQPETRLVSLTGPGGTGKTRLALEVARGLGDEYPQGVFFIDLSGITDPAQVIPTTAHTLGVREGGDQPPLEKLKGYLAARRTLLLFDNFEQVTGAALAIGELLAAAPAVTALVTSRVPLQLRGEWEFPVPPLAMPPQEDQDVEGITEYEAVALFQQAARAVQPHFEITEENRSDVVEICRRLDGLPLAIEIAAARVKMLTPAALLARLDQRLPFLVSRAVDLPARQQTLRGAIDWSYQLLGEAERQLFTRLGIFAGGFVLAAAGHVCPALDENELYDGVETLLNNSLLRQLPSVTDEPRFGMLQTIREFALEKAAETGLMEELKRAHCGYFTELASGGMDSGIYGPDSVLYMKIYEQEHDNYRQAMTWALEHPDEGVMPLLAMMTQLSWFWYRHGYLQEGSEWMQRAVEATEGMGDSPARAFALSGRGSLALWSGDLILAAERTSEAMEMGQRLDLDLVVSLTKMTYGTTLINQGKDKQAYPHLVDSVELYDQGDQQWLKGTALVHLANVSLGLGDPEQALGWLETAKPLLNATGDIWTMAFGLSNYGEVARAQGDYEEAEDYYLRTEALYQQADSKGDQARLMTCLGYIAQHKGDRERAHSLFLDSLREFRKLGNQRGMAECLAGLAGLAAEGGAQDWAAPLLSAAEARLHDIDGVWWPADRVEIERAKERLQAGLAGEFAPLWAQ
ncbi:MAG: tetratricopeptide repeat protein, partial [Anaerolineales bacterium]